MKRFYVKQAHLNTFRHLATEEYIQDHLPAKSEVMYLWRSKRALVLGKNQIPWLECRVNEFLASGGTLARRLSGGGTVYHDQRNLNYSFIGHQGVYDDDLPAHFILQGLEHFGIHGNIGERKILEIDGKKISGTAFCMRRRKVIHHGTLLIDTDLVELQKYLHPSIQLMESPAVASVPSPVINICEHNPDVNTENLSAVLYEKWGGDAFPLDESAIDKLEEKYRSDAWRWGMTPKFKLKLHKEKDYTITFRKGAVKSVECDGEDCPDSLMIGASFDEMTKLYPELWIDWTADD
ncbi:MAG: hypothetical protein MK193_08235 [Lentisphaeria bacterium]|nr:hypothetical protein [Lentisphaeria bacterium]